MLARPKASIKLNTRLLPFLVGLLVLLQLAVPYRGWMLFIVILGGLWIICFFWTRALSRGIDLRREIRFGWTQVGDRLEERFVLTNTAPFPALWLEVRDHSSMPEYDASRGTGIDANGSSEWRTSGQCRHRGVYTMGPTTISTGDPFGVYCAHVEFESTRDLLVLPAIIPLPKLTVATGGRTGEGRPRPTAMERTVSAAGVREYTPGDHWRWVHWPTSVRRNTLYVRLFESTPASDWWVILDMDAQVQVGTGERSTLEHSITLAASLVDRGIRESKAVGFSAFDEQLIWHSPRGGDTQRWKILRSMATMSTGQMRLSEFLSTMRHEFGKQTSLVIITTSLDPAWIDQLVLLMRSGVAPTILIFDAEAYAAESATDGTVALRSLLTSLGVMSYRMTPDMFDLPEAMPGHAGEWNLRELPTGMVVSVGKAPDESWRALA